MQNKSANPQDRRDSFRIDEDLLFEFKLSSSSAVNDIAAADVFDDDQALSFLSKLNQLDERSHQTLKLISEKNRLLGDFLSNLNKKIDVIGQQVAFNNESTLKSRPRTRISLSEDGLGFTCDRSLYKGSFIAVRLIFLPNYAMISSYAQIVRCLQKEDKYQVAAKFHQIYDKDRQLIARQIMRAQVKAKPPAVNNSNNA